MNDAVKYFQKMDFRDQENWLRWDLGFAVRRMAFRFIPIN